MPIQSLKTSIVVDGLTRTFMVSLPEGGGSSAPLLIALHGSTQRGSIMRRTSEFDLVAVSDGVVAIYPDAVDGIWKDGRDDDHGVDDVQFLDELIDHAVATWGVDEKRVYLVGVSNGGFMTQRFVCEMSWRLRGAASVIANLGSMVGQTCWPADPLHMFLLAGTADPVVPYDGGCVVRVDGSRYRGEVLSFVDSVAHWRRVFQWENEAARDLQRFGVMQSAETVDFEAAAHSKRLRVVTLNGGGHHWFGKQMPVELDKIFGPSCLDYKTSSEVWGFFSQCEDGVQ